MIICSNCGDENPVSHHFCQSCGASLADSESIATSSAINQLETAQPISSTAAISLVDQTAIATENPTEQISENIEIQPEPPANLLASDLLPTDLKSDEISDLTSNYQALAEMAEIQSISNLIPDDIPSDLVVQADLTASTAAIEPGAIENVENELSNSLTAAEFNDLQKIDPEDSSNPEESEVTKVLQPKTIEQTPVHLQYLRYAGLTDVGQEREHNEDNFVMLSQLFSSENAAHEVIQNQKGLFVVCDGMGGHEGGEVASAIAIEQIVQQSESFWHDQLPTEPELKQIIFSANQAIFDQNEQESRRDLGRMGTTLVMVAIHNTDVAIAHVGDSRIYRITAQKLEQITRDHEVANRLIDQGMSVVAARARADAHQLTQALGPFDNRQIAPTINYFQVTEPTLFLLCSDGLCDDNLVEENWQTHLLPLLEPDVNLRSGVQDLVYLANYLNGHDNITAIAVQCLTCLP
jgi:serine/threonine protein phosphatase PrpC